VATLAPLLDAAQSQPVALDQGVRDRNLSVIAALTHGFATQDIDLIMSHFSEGASYFDIMGNGQHGAEARGKPAIRKAFLQQFAVTGVHTYTDSVAVADIDKGFASWTLILGDLDDPHAARFAGIDEFWFDEEGKVTIKKAWLKGLPRLTRKILRHNPKALLRQLGVLAKGSAV
jgi:SnoaL-like domain